MKSLIRLDPFRAMRRWDPFSELRDMQHDMDRLFGRFLGRDISVPETGSRPCFGVDPKRLM
jgi:hypothetical protein